MTVRTQRPALGCSTTNGTAQIAVCETSLAPVRLTVGFAADLRVLLDYREDLVRERGALARVRVGLELIDDDTTVLATLCRRRLQRVIAIDTETAELNH